MLKTYVFLEEKLGCSFHFTLFDCLGLGHRSQVILHLFEVWCSVEKLCTLDIRLDDVSWKDWLGWFLTSWDYLRLRLNASVPLTSWYAIQSICPLRLCLVKVKNLGNCGSFIFSIQLSILFTKPRIASIAELILYLATSCALYIELCGSRVLTGLFLYLGHPKTIIKW